MRPLDEWDASDLQKLIDDDVQESLHLDYKASAALGPDRKGDISKDVSAFANSDGGMIVYGIVEENDHPARVDDGSDPAKITRDWLEQVISSNITPRIPVRVRQITLSNGRAAFAVQVPKAESGGPHQASDKRYYRRFESRSVPMEHYEVLEVMNRATTPELALELRVLSNVFSGPHFNPQFDVVIHNRSAQPVLYAALGLYVDARYDQADSGDFETGPQDARDQPGNTFKLKRYLRSVVAPKDRPIYREQPLSVGKFGMFIQPNAPCALHYVLTAPGFRIERTGAFVVDSAGRPWTTWSVEDHERMILL